MTQRKKIIFLAKFYFPHVGGVEKHVEIISKELIQRNFDVVIITEQFEKSLPLKEINKNLTIYRIPVGNNPYFKKFIIWRWVIKNSRLFNSSNVIHVHDVFYWMLPFRLFYPRKKIFVTFHGYEGYPFLTKWKLLRKIYENLAAGNICVGDFMKKWYGTKPDYVIYGACQISKKRNVVVPKKKSIVFFGRLDDQTNVLEYCKAFNILREKDRKWNMTVIGSGNLKDKIPKGINVRDFDPKIAEDLGAYEYIFVSRYLSMLEAMAQKRLVFAYFDNLIKKDYLAHSPFKDFVVIVNSPKKLAERLEYYSKNEARTRELLERGYAFAKEQTWDNVVSTYLNLWGI